MSSAWASNPKLRLAVKMSASLLVPALPIGVWYYSALSNRKTKENEVRTMVRVPNVQTVDDLMIERCQPGDVVLFDRRCHNCAAGPIAAFSCLMGKTFLCDVKGSKGKRGNRLADIGSFEHAGIIVPGYSANSTPAEKLDPSNLYLLEATSSSGVTARPLLTRLEMSQSRTILLLPLSSPGERRNDDTYDPSPKTRRLKRHLQKTLINFRDTWVAESQKQNYAGGHATLGVIGAIGYAMGIGGVSRAPVSPSAWLVVSALQEAGVGVFLSERTAMESRVEGFLGDHRFDEGKEVVRLRPGWSFKSPVVMRETSRSAD